MKQCCKDPANWKHDGARNKKVIDRGGMVNITHQNYLTCNVCKKKLSMFVNKNIVEVVRKEVITSERP